MLKGAGSARFVGAVVCKRAQGISAGTGALSEVRGGGSVGCRLILHMGLAGGSRTEKQDASSASVLAGFRTGVASSCGIRGDPKCSQFIRGGPAGGNLTWRLSDGSDCCPLHATGLTTGGVDEPKAESGPEKGSLC